MKNENFSIGNKSIKRHSNVFIIAEVGQAHDGSLGLAHSYIDAAAECNVDAVKFQTHFAKEESSKHDTFRVNFSYEDKSRYDYWKRLEFTEQQWAELKNHCDAKGVTFLSSVFSHKAVDLLANLGVDAWKIASGEVSNTPMLLKILETKKPVIASNGLCDLNDLTELKKECDNRDVPLAILQCTSQYPCLPESIDIKNIAYLQKMFKTSVGLSDHSGSVLPSIAAMALGASILEVHMTFDKRSFGPDSKSSLTIEQLKELCAARDLFADLFKDNVGNQDSTEMKKLFEKSFYALSDIKAGDKFNWANVITLKPALGIHASQYQKLIGIKSNKFIRAGDPIYFEDTINEKTQGT